MGNGRSYAETVTCGCSKGSCSAVTGGASVACLVDIASCCSGQVHSELRGLEDRVAASPEG